ncbi:E3 ubiquitin-protein ligase WAV3-like [Silene latifolia]|uniref:E3 ubiquitin-protein ligase WAV3-like n=1 Tax=Silene latifolia TaxID=37657 RepID=UPI003D779E35
MYVSEEICNICNRYMNTGPLFIAECSHKFHYNCIFSNLQNSSHTCPTCHATWTQLHSPFARRPLQVPQFIPTFPHGTSKLPLQGNLKATPAVPTNVDPNFNDDEALPSSRQTPPATQQDGGPMTVKALTEYTALSKSDQSDSFAVLVSIRAPLFPPEATDEGNSRAPLDLVAVLDVSGSMFGQKIALLKQALNFVIQNLGPADRLSVITFSTSSQRLTPLKRMTQAGQADTIRVVDSIRAEGSTNIIAGLQTAVKVLDQRREKNPVTSIILLSDGKDTDNRNFTSCLSQLPQTIRSNAVGLSLTPTEKVPVYTFGFGSDHDAKALHAISDGSVGTFSYIEAIEVLQDAFAQCLGGLLSVVAQEVEIQVRSRCPEVRIKSIPSGRYKNTIDSFGGQHGVVYVGDVYADEEKQFLVYLSVPKAEENEGETSTTKLLEVKCLYKNPISNEKIESDTARAEIRRPLKEELSEEDKRVCLEVDREKNRIIIAEGIAEAQEMAERGELSGARSTLERKRKMVMESSSGIAGDERTELLSRQAQIVSESMSSRKAYMEGGRAFGLSAQSSHNYQRAAAQMLQSKNIVGQFPPMSGPPDGVDANFQTTYMQQMMVKSQQQKQQLQQLLQQPLQLGPILEYQQQRQQRPLQQFTDQNQYFGGDGPSIL